jgi:LuxR family maltose regulon positive regulatory protein
LLRELQSAQVLFAIQANDISALGWWVKMVSVEQQTILYLKKEAEAFTLARLQIVDGKIDEAIKLLQRWRADAVTNGRVRSQVEALCLEAVAYQAAANRAAASQSLSEALTLGQEKGFRRLFLDEGARLAHLLQSSLSTLPSRALGLFASTLLQSFATEAISPLSTRSSTIQIEPLSPQEMRVLRLLVNGLSNADIAQELIVSTNTIKTHVKSIYRKLNITSRGEAREVARELKLL